MAKDPGRLEEADQLYRQAIAMRQDYVQAYINRVIYLMYLRMIWMVTFFKENLNFVKLEFWFFIVKYRKYQVDQM